MTFLEFVTDPLILGFFAALALVTVLILGIMRWAVFDAVAEQDAEIRRKNRPGC